MAKFLSGTELYEAVQKKSQETNGILWVCSPLLGPGAHKIFSQEIVKKQQSDIRFIFRLNDAAIKDGETDPHEIQFLLDRLNCTIKLLDVFHTNIFIFDDSALLTSAGLTETAFENDMEAGVMLEGSEADEVRNFFSQNLWKYAKPLGDLSKPKKVWNLMQKQLTKKVILKKRKQLTQIKDWTDEYFNSWYVGILSQVSKKTERNIKKATGWATELAVVGDIGYSAFKQLKLGDLTYLAHLYKKGNKIKIETARVVDKGKVETDEGDLHFVCRVEKDYLLGREQFFGLLKDMNVNSKTSETKLNGQQIKCLTGSLSSIKVKRKRKQKNKGTDQKRIH